MRSPDLDEAKRRHRALIARADAVIAEAFRHAQDGALAGTRRRRRPS